MAKAEPSADRRIIAISVTYRAYDETQKLKGDRTWTGYALQLAQLEHPENTVLMDEINSLPKKEPKSEKPKKPKAEKKGKKDKKPAKREESMEISTSAEST